MKNYIGILKLTKAKYRLAIATIVDKTNYQSLDNVFIKEIQKNKYNEIILNGDQYVGKCYADIFITNYHSNIFKQANIKLSDMLVTINVSKISKYVKTYVEKAASLNECDDIIKGIESRIKNLKEKPNQKTLK